MAATVLADTGFLVAYLSGRDVRHAWALTVAQRHPPPWHSCDAVLSEAFYLLASHATVSLAELIRRGALRPTFRLADDVNAVLDLMRKYADVPMAFADACLVRMSEQLPNPVVLTTDSDFRIYRQQNRRVVPCVLP